MSDIKSSKVLIIILIFVLFFVLTGGFFLGYKILTAKDSKEPVPKEVKLGPVFETEQFTVNVSETLNRYIKAQFALEMSNEKAKTELDTKIPLLQDTIIMVLSNQKLEKLSTNEGKQELRNELINSINQFLNKGEVINIYYINLIIS